MKRKPPPSKIQETAGRLADAMLEALRREYTGATSEALLEGNGFTQIASIMDGLTTCDGLEDEDAHAPGESR